MIYEFHFYGEPIELLLISSIIPPPWYGAVLLLLTIPLILWFWWLRARRNSSHLDNATLITVTPAFLGTYIFTSQYNDEVFINLEHSYNLFHHGLFSFSPERMVDGTVEFLYYLLLTPFAVDQRTLIYASFLLGACIGWLHLLLIWLLLSRRSINLKLLLLIVFSVSVPLITMFSSGFGYGLVSLVLFLSIYHQLKGKADRALYIAALLPFIRPTAILYSGAVFLVDFIQRRRLRPTAFLLVLSLGSYLGLVRLFYGHWIPTPMVFKSLSPAMLANMSLRQPGEAVLYFFEPLHLAAVLFFVLRALSM